jgi:hypothetical protein
VLRGQLVIGGAKSNANASFATHRRDIIVKAQQKAQ